MKHTNIVSRFESDLSLTEQDLIELSNKKTNLVLDVSTVEGFKSARKERTERNEIEKKIDRLAIDAKSSIDDVRNALKLKVSDIYEPVVKLFEIEEVKQKQEKKKKAEKEKARLDAIKDKINNIRYWSQGLSVKSSEDIQDIIEAVDLIDVTESFAELTQEAIATKIETITELTNGLTAAIQRELLQEAMKAIEIERKQLDDERKALDLQKNEPQKETLHSEKVINEVTCEVPLSLIKAVSQIGIDGYELELKYINKALSIYDEYS